MKKNEICVAIIVILYLATVISIIQYMMYEPLPEPLVKFIERGWCIGTCSTETGYCDIQFQNGEKYHTPINSDKKTCSDY